ncbi:DEAD-box ATP-dependent RNA helicase 14 [Symbiodinium microadriaticum]|uniref:DEAD-box ATP-dependent RNA helicase 14 n=1 Tax=Symbiodinium microadriaticum TaxID=2951 RepID=A0A1Q9DNZ8_SYMMI|nr:DEAD-box ATP-dependent RNA helicase 14 [Symbiodinium microadriaticum]
MQHKTRTFQRIFRTRSHEDLELDKEQAVRQLAFDFLQRPIHVHIGEMNTAKANTDVTQHVVLLDRPFDKDQKLDEMLLEHLGEDELAIVFVSTKRSVEEIARLLMRHSYGVTEIHGDKDQRERDLALRSFTNKEKRVMIATDVASRGLDIKGVKLVINYDAANTPEDYVHRIGRTGRAGEKGISYTFLVRDDPTDVKKAKAILDVMQTADQAIPEELRLLVGVKASKGGGKGGKAHKGGGKNGGKSGKGSFKGKGGGNYARSGPPPGPLAGVAPMQGGLMGGYGGSVIHCHIASAREIVDQSLSFGSLPFAGTMAVSVMAPEILSLAGYNAVDLASGSGFPAEGSFTGLDLSLLEGEVDEDVVQQSLQFTRLSGKKANLRLAHVDLGSGTDAEQRMFDLRAERELRSTERAVHVGKKSESAKQKDFAVSAQMRRDATAGIEAADQRLAEIDAELQELETLQSSFSWFQLFSQLQAQSVNYVGHLDLSNCGLHATAIELLQKVLLDLEHRGDGYAVEELVLDSNDLGDASTVALASLIRLSSRIQVLRLRNIGITDGGFSQLISAIVGNKSLCLLDLRGNGLCTLENSKVVVQGLRRFNQLVQILVE